MSKELLTVYTVKIPSIPTVWLFKYDLNGLLKEWVLDEEGELSEEQIRWLFHPARFPYHESTIKHFEAVKNIEVLKGEPDISFDAFWRLYNLKVGKLETGKAWKRLSKADKLTAIKQLAAYNGYLKRSRKEKVYPATYLNKRRFDDQFNSL